MPNVSLLEMRSSREPPNLRRRMSTELTKTVRGDSRLERLSIRSMILLLKTLGKCSHLRAKPAHFVGHLPLARGQGQADRRKRSVRSLQRSSNIGKAEQIADDDFRALLFQCFRAGILMLHKCADLVPACQQQCGGMSPSLTSRTSNEEDFLCHEFFSLCLLFS